ncbi:MAG: DUF6290 family protein [Carnobacterium sp.]
MAVISVRINSQEEKLIEEYANSRNMTVSTLFRESVLEKIEDDINLGLYRQAMKEHKENSQKISFEDMLKKLID